MITNICQKRLVDYGLKNSQSLEPDRFKIQNPKSKIPPSGRLRLDDMIANSVADEFADRVETKFAHDRSAVGFGGFDADSEAGGDLLVTFSFGEELDDFAFAVGGSGGAGVS